MPNSQLFSEDRPAKDFWDCKAASRVTCTISCELSGFLTRTRV